jgi:tRNA pseudouridine32 synthase/23S rRNA pseudouridine746 synthase
MDWLIHLDAECVVVDKPAGMLSVPGRGPERADCAWARVLALAPDAQVVHRLDMATSGLLLFARGAAMQRALSIAFAERRVHKRYQAVVEGGPAADAGEVDLPLIADWPRRPRQKVDAALGKPSLTRWQVLSRELGPQGRRTRLLLEPVTGRSHQLRVHAAASGWPIAGDELYGDATSAPRLLLHAYELSLAHPLDGRALRWTSPPPF